VKLLPTLFAVLGIALAAGAQTNSAKYVPKASDMRIVEGKMYNRELSTNWVTLPIAGGSLVVVEVIPGGVVVKGSVKSGEKAETMLIKHCPGEKDLAKGKSISSPFRAMPVAAVKYGSATVAAYDCGLANTPENRKTLTNGPIHVGS
jgi:hypothetical protein